MLNRDRATRGIEEHVEIVEAIRSGDGDRAEAIARRHIRTTIDHLTRAST